MFGKQINSIIEMIEYFPDEQSCIDYFEKMRWNGEVISPFDQTSKVYKCSGNKYRCKNTGKYFNVKTGTLFDNSKIKLKKWFLAIWLAASHKKGISSMQLAKDIHVTQKTAWFMLQRIRKCFELDNTIENDKMDGELEVDETYVGGKNANRHYNKKFDYRKGRTYQDKCPVFGMVQRGGKAIAKVVPDVKGNTLKYLIYAFAKKGCTINSDEWWGYNGLDRDFIHKIIKHKEKIYGIEDAHTNTIEGFWSHIKRGIIGIYHNVSKKHLQRYIDEFVFRYNTRRVLDIERFNMALKKPGYRLKYVELIQ